MSRIEEALEKAVKTRSAGKGHNGGIKPASQAEMTSAPPGKIFSPARGAISVKNPTLVAATAPQSPIAEEYRKLKEMVIKLTQADQTKNTLMVTSAMVGEGKSTTSLNLAISLAQEFDHTVLLIDADLRKPSIEKYLDLNPKPGLTDCLLDNVEIQDVLLKTGIGKMMILPAGRIASNPGELFSSNKMSSLITEIKHRYADRYIIIDTPPVLPFAETRTMSRIVDGVIVVVKAGLCSPEDVQEALNAMHGANILGLVYNQATFDTLSTSYAYYNNY